MPHVTIETQFDPKTGKYNLAVYSGASNNPSLELGEPIYIRKRIDEENVYLAKFAIRDDFIGVGDPVHFAPLCRHIGEPAPPLRLAARQASSESARRESFRVQGQSLLETLKSELDDLNSADLCTVANIVFGGVRVRSEHDEALDEEVFVVEALTGSSMHDYARTKLSGGIIDKPKTATGPKV
jgi:hypothetical protein